MLNKVMIIGRLGRDPELKYSTAGMAIANLNIATDESYVDREGNKVERTEWHRVVVFQRAAENCANYLAKGSLVFVEGSLQTRKWQDQQGQDRYSTEIKANRVQFLDRKGDRQGQGQGDDYGADYGGGDYSGGSGHGAGRPPQRGGQNRPDQNRQDQNRPDQRGGGRGGPQQPQGASSDDMGPAFPSEAGGMDDVPF